MTVDLALPLWCAAERFGLDRPDWQVTRHGAGGQSTAYCAEARGTAVCIKVAAPGSVHLQREVVMLERLASPHVPRLLVDGVSLGFVIEEFVAARPLSTFAPQALRFALPHIVRGLAVGLSTFAAARPVIVHRDLKPANLGLATRGVQGTRLMIFDYGSAEFEGRRARAAAPCSVTLSKVGRGTHRSQPLEQLMRSPAQDRRVDVFAAASVVFWILTGRAPFANAQAGEDEARAAYRAAEAELPRALAAWPAELRLRLTEALRVSPERRPDSLWPLYGAVHMLVEREAACCASR